jgi:hypothetical protein
MVRGTEVEEVQTKLLKISKMIQEASVGYLQVPLSMLFVLGMVVAVVAMIKLYNDPHTDKYIIPNEIIWVAFLEAAIVTPIWLLTRIEKFYLWTLRELLHRNTVMPRTDRTYLISNYDTIAPRAASQYIWYLHHKRSCCVYHHSDIWFYWIKNWHVCVSKFSQAS